MDLTLDETKTNKCTESLKSKGGWIEDDECDARLIYVNGRFVLSLSITSNIARNIVSDSLTSGNMSTECTVLKLNCINVWNWMALHRYFFCEALVKEDDDVVNGGGAEERMRLVINQSFDMFWNRKFETVNGLVDTFILLYEYQLIRLCFLVWILNGFIDVL